MLLHITAHLRENAFRYAARSRASFDVTFAATGVFATFLAIMALQALGQGGLKAFFVITQAIICVLAPRTIGEALRAPLPRFVELAIALHVGLSLVGGELMKFYDRFWWWDIVPHVLAGFLAAYIASFALVRTFGVPVTTKRRALVAILAIAASLGISGIWELYEFAADVLFGSLMQTSGQDTMHDLGFGMLGAIFILFLPYPRFTPRS